MAQLRGPPQTNQWKIKIVPVCWCSAASAGPLNDPFLGIVTSWGWPGGVRTKPPNLQGGGRGPGNTLLGRATWWWWLAGRLREKVALGSAGGRTCAPALLWVLPLQFLLPAVLFLPQLTWGTF